MIDSELAWWYAEEDMRVWYSSALALSPALTMRGQELRGAVIGRVLDASNATPP